MRKRSYRPGKYRKLTDWTARVIVRTPSGIVAMRHTCGEWHLPGGKREPSDAKPHVTAKREVYEEIGLPYNVGSALQDVCSRSSRQGKRNKYDIHYFTRTLTQEEVDTHLRVVGSEGEEVRVIPYKEFEDIEGFRKSELRVIKRHNLHIRPRQSRKPRA